MKNLKVGVMKISISPVMNPNLANMPSFNVCGLKLDSDRNSLMVPKGYDDEGNVTDGFLLEEDCNDVYGYQSLYVDCRGNTHYGRTFSMDGSPDVVFGSGWSSRASVVAKLFNAPLVECNNGLALLYSNFLHIVDSLYTGEVYIGVECGDEIDITIIPFDASRMSKFDDSRTYADVSIVLNTKYREIFYDLACSFIEDALEGHLDLEEGYMDVRSFNYTPI